MKKKKIHEIKTGVLWAAFNFDLNFSYICSGLLFKPTPKPN